MVEFIFSLFVFTVPPQIAPFDISEDPLNAGEFFQVTCSVKGGDLPIKISWMLNNKDVALYPEISTSLIGKRGSALSIESISHEHAGKYTCLASNLAGNETYSSNLLVNGDV